MDFAKHMLPVKKESVFSQDGYFVWCGTMAKKDDTYYLFFSRWPKETGANGWVVCSEVGVASAASPTGPFTFEKIVLAGSGKGWDRDCIHNPAVLEFDGKYYLYYMGNYGNGTFWDHRNHQRIGVAVAEHPLGPWQRFDKPVIDVREGMFDDLMTSNPSVAITPEHGIIMIHKGVSSKGEPPKGGAVVCGVAWADHPLGPFTRKETPIMVNPENEWSVEDPFVWCMDGKYYSIVKDFQGYFTGIGEPSLALFVSDNGVDWDVDHDHPLASRRRIVWEDGKIEAVHNFERPQIYLENGVPKVLLCAVSRGPMEEGETFNVQVPLQF